MSTGIGVGLIIVTRGCEGGNTRTGGQARTGRGEDRGCTTRVGVRGSLFSPVLLARQELFSCVVMFVFSNFTPLLFR